MQYVHGTTSHRAAWIKTEGVLTSPFGEVFAFPASETGIQLASEFARDKSREAPCEGGPAVVIFGTDMEPTVVEDHGNGATVVSWWMGHLRIEDIEVRVLDASGRAPRKPFFKSKFYPVDVTQMLIYDDPKDREGDCSLPSRVYGKAGTLGIKGERLNHFACYKEFQIVPPLKRGEAPREPLGLPHLWCRAFTPEQVTPMQNLRAIRSQADAITAYPVTPEGKKQAAASVGNDESEVVLVTFRTLRAPDYTEAQGEGIFMTPFLPVQIVSVEEIIGGEAA